MTEYQRRQIAAYLPSPRDKTLNDFEYYVLDTADRVRKVYVRDILPHDEETTYGCYEVSTNRRIIRMLMAAKKKTSRVSGSTRA